MAIRNIVKDNDPLLKKRCREVENIDDKIITLLDDMRDTLAVANGVGLAAPQVGILRRVIIVDTGEEILELINPVIVKQSGHQDSLEGCLSVPGIRGHVDRPKKVTVQGYDREGNLMEYKAQDFVATIFCHETDHLDGILFTDKATRCGKDD
ncbi:MAG: peptide deformylase [Clostridia bacterium]|jgi:peptide deformylase|nr:peptide deformylase [Clostridia bacterium]